MIQSVHFRERNPLGDSEWRSGQLEQSSSPPFQRRYDLGFDIGALAEDYDALVSPRLSTKTVQINDQLLSRYGELQKSLDRWFLDFQSENTSFFCWDTTEVSSGGGSNLFRLPDLPLTFRSLNVAQSLTTYWALQLLFIVAIIKLHQLISQELGAESRISSSTVPFLRPVAFSTSSTHLNIVESNIPRINPSQIISLATLITRSSSYCISDNAGQSRPLRYLFPLRIALISFQRNAGRGERYLQWCQELYVKLITNKHVGYARDLGNVTSRWQNS